MIHLPSLRSRLFLILSLLIAPILLTSCDPEDVDFLAELAVEYAQGKGILNEEGDLKWRTLVTYGVAGTTGDRETDAALQAGVVVKGMESADELAQQGAEEGDPKKIQSAINIRPGDWSYREQHAALLMAQGDGNGAIAAFEASDQLINERIDAGGECEFLRLNQLRHREQAILTQMQRQPTNDDLINTFDGLLLETQDEIADLESGGSGNCF